MRVETNKINATDYRGIFEEIKTKYPDIDEAEQMAAAEHIYTNDEDYETSTEADFGRAMVDDCHSGPKTLDDLFEQIKSGALDHLSGNEWAELPVFGGTEPNCTIGVWSWDETRLLVGTCADDMRIVNREDR